MADTLSRARSAIIVGLAPIRSNGKCIMTQRSREQQYKFLELSKHGFITDEREVTTSVMR